MYIKNILNINLPNPIHPEWYNYRKYKNLINKMFKIEMEQRAIGIHGINKILPREKFWDIVNGIWDGQIDLYVRITFHVAYNINLRILVEDKKIDKRFYVINVEFFNYLRNVFFNPFKEKFSQKFWKDFLEIVPIYPEFLGIYRQIMSSDPELLKELKD